MKSNGAKSLFLALLWTLIMVSSIARAQQPPAEQPPDNVEGKWTIYAKDPDGATSTKYLEIKQNGTAISGHFKGPHQSGGIEGTINVHHIVIRTKTRDVLTFRGKVEGNKMSGNFGNRGRHGEWEAVRSE
ncbi:MAG: hypothetical protein WA673_17115 [Candidatus Acidiferrales bacterium]